MGGPFFRHDGIACLSWIDSGRLALFRKKTDLKPFTQKPLAMGRKYNMRLRVWNKETLEYEDIVLTLVYNGAVLTVTGEESAGHLGASVLYPGDEFLMEFNKPKGSSEPLDLGCGPACP